MYSYNCNFLKKNLVEFATNFGHGGALWQPTVESGALDFCCLELCCQTLEICIVQDSPISIIQNETCRNENEIVNLKVKLNGGGYSFKDIFYCR